ncbi:apolipoprotein N-acyltransferase [Actinomadura sp. HBU206391]|uniref:apolipoprotein N-acyltransferase n=1 Tax=Actinomadura sp. HBU206391 TaxID=2731692 RepID=UPI00164F982A|nr:apolipoprotein N-acyltransferase [Actinomadura sp. HBU206391]MBC6462384.1 apolipoprotein N-acyltransferase [Actinomadura sp. HBU206391]
MALDTAAATAPGTRAARVRTLLALPAGALPLLTFPRADAGWLAWVILVPGLLIIRSAPDARTAAVRGWWFGAGYLLAALYWTIPNIGPGLLLVAAVFGALWAGWGLAAWTTLRDPVRPLRALLLVPSAWVAIEYARSWHALGGPWALFGASQWRHPVVLSLAALGGVWLVTFALVAVNTALVIALVSPPSRVRALTAALVIGLAGPVAFALRGEPQAVRTVRVALVQPGVVHDPTTRFAAGERITRGTPPADLVVWGESSVGFDLERRADLTARLRELARSADLLVNEDARDARGRISKSSLLIGPNGIRGRYVKTRLVPFGEYIPFRPALGWLTAISKAAGEDRVPGTGVRVLRADGVTIGPLICFESAFPDLGREVARRGAQLIVYQSATSTFQGSWAPAQHAALAAVRSAETGRPSVQAALTGVSAAYDARGRRSTWFDTDRRGSVIATVRVPAATDRTPYDRYGDLVAYLAVALSGVAAARLGYGRLRTRT